MKISKAITFKNITTSYLSVMPNSDDKYYKI